MRAPSPASDCDARADSGADELAAFRLGSRWEIAGWLGELARREAALDLHTPDGTACSAVLEPFDPRQDTLTLRVAPAQVHVPALTEAEEVDVSAVLDGVRLQFTMRHLVEVQGQSRRELRGSMPAELYRWQRRDAYRVRPRQHTAPVARIASATAPALAVRILDVSIGGCSLFMPNDALPAAAGLLLAGVELDLDADTRFRVDLRVLHAMPPEPGARGARVGCGFVDAPASAQRALQRFIDTTQKRERQLAGR